MYIIMRTLAHMCVYIYIYIHTYIHTYTHIHMHQETGKIPARSAVLLYLPGNL